MQLMLFIILAIPGLAILALVIYSCVLGAQAFSSANQFHGEQAATIRYLALNLCEPIAGIPLTLLTLYLLRDAVFEFFPVGFVVIWPMWSLLIAGRGMGFQNPTYRQVSSTIFGLGALRLLWNGLCFTALATGPDENTLWPIIMVVFPIISTGTLIYTIYWAKRQLKRTSAAPPASIEPIAPIVPIASARPAPTVDMVPIGSVHGTPPVQLSYRSATPCPNCMVLMPFKATACPDCGLIAASRVPESLRDLPRYTALRPIGAGGMSHIYLAEDRASAAICVLKAVASADGGNTSWQREARYCLEREALLLRDVQHPGIITLLGWYPEMVAPFMALEYVAGPSLEQRLETGTLSVGEILRHGAAIADVITFLAGLKHPIVHCDIKPGNLIAPEIGAPAILVDFGSAIVLNAITPENQPEHYGTPGYAAPEQYHRQAHCKSDVYGLAATLYHLLANEDPTKHPLAFPALSRIPTEIAAALTPALEHDPALRPTPAAFSAVLHGLAGRYR
ncbi:MAG: serine/threonine-protein kinase [Roseiflexaceae bacterium]|nr:serine/threonine-protein kinase [Roseiflexaceae bacterium]